LSENAGTFFAKTVTNMQLPGMPEKDYLRGVAGDKPKGDCDRCCVESRLENPPI
jgi:hypothetical protein